MWHRFSLLGTAPSLLDSRLPRSGARQHRCRTVLGLARPVGSVAAAAGRSQRAEVSPLLASVLSQVEAPEGSSMQELLRVSEAYWKALRHSKDQPGKPGPTVVRRTSGSLGRAPQYDVCICGGTLGVLVGLALLNRGHRVAIVERRKLEGRNQEWNIGREQLQRLVAEGLLSQSELEGCIVSEFNPVRVGLAGMERDILIEGVLNLGVQPRLLLGCLKRRFLERGGTLLEHTSFRAAEVFDDGVLLRTAAGRADALSPGDANRPLACAATLGAADTGGAGDAGAPSAGSRAGVLTCRLVLDCMGHWGPIVKQLRGGAKPSGVVAVVGGCMGGVPPECNTSGDLLYSLRDSEDDLQMFWEAFPAAGGDRTAYMFCYTDAHPDRPTFAHLLDKFLRQLPDYQGIPLDQLQFRRVLFGAFPCYPGSSPLAPGFDRVLQIGDSAASHSPLSFGGFGNMVRRLPLLAEGLDDALRGDLLSRADLAWLQPYQPSLSAAWLFQRAMSVGVGQLRRPGAAGAGAAALARQPPPAQHVPAPPGGSVSNTIVPAPGLRHELREEREQAHGAHAALATASPAAAAAASALAVEERQSSPTLRTARMPSSPRGAPGQPPSHLPHPQWEGQKLHSSGSSSGGSSGGSSMDPPQSGAGASSSEGSPQAAATPGAAAGTTAAAGAGTGWMDPGHVNRLMRANFSVMRMLGEGVMRPFLEDTLRFVPLALTMAGMSLRDPLVVFNVVRHLGMKALVEWTGHFLMMGLFSLLHLLLSPLRAWVRTWPRSAGGGGTAQHTQQGGEAGGATASAAGGLGAWGALVRWRYAFLRLLDALASGSGMD